MASGSLLPAFAEPVAAPSTPYYLDPRQAAHHPIQNGGYAIPIGPSGNGLGQPQMYYAAPQGPQYLPPQHPHQPAQQQQPQYQTYQKPFLHMDGQYAQSQARSSVDAGPSQPLGSGMMNGGGNGGAAGSSGGQAIVYITSYSGIPVYEAMIRNVAVMMRRSDRWLNASQILKVAGINKVARGRIVDVELALGEHEKVSAEYGKYQGTWVPHAVGLLLAQKYHVHHLLSPLFQLASDPSASAGQAAFPTLTPQKGAGSPPGVLKVGKRLSLGSNGRLSSRSGGTGSELSPPMGGPGDAGRMRLGDTASGYVDSLPAPKPEQGLQAAPELFSAHKGGPSSKAKRARSVSSQDGEPVSKRVRGEGGTDGQLAAAFMPTVLEREETRPASEPDVFMDGDADGDSETSTESERDRRGLPPNTTLATRPTRPQMNAPFGVVKMEEAAKSRARTKLLAIFRVAEGENADLDSLLLPEVKSSPSGVGAEVEAAEPLDIDQVIDEKGHTALHWAVALARSSVISGLIARGADVHRGNFAGETPLIRSVLTTNTADAGTFGELLAHHLGSTLRTLDFSHRSVLHHIALVAAIKGRAGSANTYMSALLEWLSSAKDRMSMQAFVNIQDVHGDTALITAARVGNKNLVKLLLDAGADKTLANELGLRPVDFGIDVRGLECDTGPISASSSQTSANRPHQKGESILQHLTQMIQEVNDDFSREIRERQERLDRLQIEVKAATRDLATERSSLRSAQSRAAELEKAKQNVLNLEKAIKDEAEFRYIAVAPPPLPAPSATDTVSVDPSHSELEGQSVAKLPYLRTLRMWQNRSVSILDQRLREIEGMEAEKSVQYKKVIAACAKVAVDKVDDRLLEDLTAAVESDGLALDLGRASAFLQRAEAAIAA